MHYYEDTKRKVTVSPKAMAEYNDMVLRFTEAGLSFGYPAETAIRDAYRAADLLWAENDRRFKMVTGPEDD